ncbi:hypothetical protein [Aeromicrobium piscarium]|uniref:Uncharacterized protein n=1 Tax=Aeromicrobium piscarium TaxID=2590901 RepID=A0A554S6X4_9ACTN|nr:hypothetical protein [Aeromicrobium piscarium]TSD62104.1 hypothetical protein FNM00_13385 [Aeromicrobium piscarium]
MMRGTRFRQVLVGLGAALIVVISTSMNAVSSSGLPPEDVSDRRMSAKEALHMDAEATGVAPEQLNWETEFSELVTSYSMDQSRGYSYSEIVAPREAVLAFSGVAPEGLDEKIATLGGRVKVLEHTGFTELEIQEAAGRAVQVVLDLGATSVLAIPDARDRIITVSFSGVALDAAELGRVQSIIEDDVLGGGLAAAGFSVDFEESGAAVFEADDLARGE